MDDGKLNELKNLIIPLRCQNENKGKKNIFKSVTLIEQNKFSEATLLLLNILLKFCKLKLLKGLKRAVDSFGKHIFTL